MKLRQISTLLLLLSATFTAVSSYAEDSIISSQIADQASTERLDASEPVAYDLGRKIAVVFYYTDSNGDRLLVTAIGPKDPDSGEASTQQIIKMDSAGQYVINIASDHNGSAPMKLSAHFEGSDLIVSFNKV